jgi:F0F1-type ATP synthase delta subunit
MLARAYAEALYRALEKLHDAKIAFLNLQKILERRGHTRLFPAIAREFKRLTASHGSVSGVLEVARLKDQERYKDKIADASTQMGLSVDALEVRENPRLIGGYVVRKSDEQYDASFRRALMTLYRQLVA